MKVPLPYPVIVLLATVCGALAAPALGVLWPTVLECLMTAALGDPGTVDRTTWHSALEGGYQPGEQISWIVSWLAGAGIFALLASAAGSARQLKQRCFLTGVGILTLAALATLSLVKWIHLLGKWVLPYHPFAVVLCIIFLVLMGLVITMASFSIPEPPLVDREPGAH